MKKAILAVICLLPILGFSQEDNSDNNIRKHELRADGFDLAFFTSLDVSYEMVGNQNSGYGISLFANFRGNDGYWEKFSATPFYRFYFFNKEDYGARGFYAELFTKFVTGEDEFFIDGLDTDENFFDIYGGLSIGQKWVNKNGFVLDISIGGGRKFGLDDLAPEFSFRGGISLGYRF